MSGRPPLVPVANKRPVGRPKASLAGGFSSAIRGELVAAASAQWPNPIWQSDPLGFAETICGVDLWSFQVEFLEAIRDNRHVAVAGGRKIGKDFAVGVAALWWYCSWVDSRVILLAPTAKQLDGIAYREIKMLVAASGRCLACKLEDPHGPRPCPHSAIITGSVGVKAHTGIKSPDFREIVGMTAMSEGGLRGMSGARILAIEDEASDIKDEFDTALVGNLAGADCHRVLISNPCRTMGFFHRAFHEERDLYRRLQVSTLENPNITSGETLYRGLADAQWVAERATAWGRGSAAWLANVEGQFVKAEAGQLFTLEAIKDAETRYDDAERTGRLVIGLDVAGESTDGDETVFCPRRARRAIKLTAFRGLSPDGILVNLIALLAEQRIPSDIGDAIPVVVVDRDGPIGARVYDTLNAYRRRDEKTEQAFRLVGFRGSAPPLGRSGEIYRYNRDALYGGLVDALREGLAIPADVKLEGELVALRWLDVERGKSQLIHKSDLRDRLGRSPDRCDALALSTWGERRVMAQGGAPPGPGLARVQSPDDLRYGGGLDPNIGQIDPYG